MAALLAGITNPGVSQAQTNVDYDTDDDGLIEVDSLAKLNAIRYDLNGDGQVAAGDATNYAAGFPNFDAASCPDNDMPADGASYDCEGYELTANLDFDTDGNGSTHTAGAGDANDTYYNGGAGWTPIGVSSTGAATAYTATFDGNNNTISNLFISLNTSTSDGGSFVGLFGDFNGTIRNVGLVNPYIANTRTGSGWDRTGALAGRGQGNAITISNSYVSGGSVTLSQNTNSSSSSVVGCLVGFVGPSNGTLSDSWTSCALSVDSTGANTGTVYAGGIAGQLEGAISSSYATGTVTSLGTVENDIGGLVGWAIGNITGSYAVGNVTSSNSVGTPRIGGLVGAGPTGVNIRASYARGNVSDSGADSRVGGLAGFLAGSSAVVQASYAAGSVTASGANSGTGGLIGQSFLSNGQVQAVYASGAVSNSGTGRSTGGLVGYLSGIAPTMPVASNGYWDTAATGQPTSVGGGQGKTTSELQTPTGYAGIYANWNLDLDSVAGNDDPWDFGTNLQYPILTYGHSAASIAAQKTTQDTTLRSVTGTSVERTIATGATTYTLEIIPPETTAVTLTLTPSQSDAVVGSLATTTPGASVDGLEVTLAPGETPTLITATVTAPNGHYTRQYTLTLQRIFGPEAALSGPAHAVGEGQDAEFTVLVRRTAESPVTVRWTASGNAPTTPADFSNADHTAPLPGFPSGTVTVPPGADQTATITIPIYDDDDAEGSETFQVAITGVSGGATRFDATPATATIALSDPTLELQSAAGATLTASSRLVITEGRANAYTIRLAHDPDEPVTVVIHSNHDAVTTTPSTVTLTADNYAQPQRVTVNAAPDGDAKNETATLTHILTDADGGLLEIIDRLPLFVADPDPPDDDDIC